MTFRDLLYALFSGPFATLWPMLVAPTLAAFVSERMARALDRSGERRWLAAALAVTPGVLLLSLTYVPARDVLTGAYPISLKGWLLWWAPLILAGLCLVHAIVRTVARQWTLARLFRLGRPATGELDALARGLGVRARLVEHDGIDCFVAGFFRPTVFVSRGALDAFDALELRAAMAHEASHIHGRDGAMIAILGFFCDLVPLPWPAPLAAFRDACENRADRAASEAVGAVHLASALVAAAGQRRVRPAHAFGLGGQEVLRLRLQRLLHGPAAVPPNRRAGISLACGLLALATLASFPIAQAAMICTDHVEGRLARWQCPYHALRLNAAAAGPGVRAAGRTAA